MTSKQMQSLPPGGHAITGLLPATSHAPWPLQHICVSEHA
jgi:hypothetical protein